MLRDMPLLVRSEEVPVVVDLPLGLELLRAVAEKLRLRLHLHLSRKSFGTMPKSGSLVTSQREVTMNWNTLTPDNAGMRLWMLSAGALS